eukprot:scaffold7106_cov279-Amphora_coffeaeformis.AAC.1
MESLATKCQWRGTGTCQHNDRQTCAWVTRAGSRRLRHCHPFPWHLAPSGSMHLSKSVFVVVWCVVTDMMRGKRWGKQTQLLFVWLSLRAL